ncbi:hypothetical protein LguiB_032025 [Lonicera macranthoides]
MNPPLQVLKTSLFEEQVVVLCGPAGNKFLFGNENKHVAVCLPSSMRKVFGKCLLTSVGEEAKWMRKMLSSFLTPDAFSRLYITTMGEVTQQHIKTHWQVSRIPPMKMGLVLRLLGLALQDGDPPNVMHRPKVRRS